MKNTITAEVKILDSVCNGLHSKWVPSVCLIVLFDLGCVFVREIREMLENKGPRVNR